MDERGESAPKESKRVPSAGKVMVSVFCSMREIIVINYLQKEKTINGEYYANLMQRTTDEINNKWPDLTKKKVLYH